MDCMQRRPEGGNQGQRKGAGSSKLQPDKRQRGNKTVTDKVLSKREQKRAAAEGPQRLHKVSLKAENQQ